MIRWQAWHCTKAQCSLTYFLLVLHSCMQASAACLLRMQLRSRLRIVCVCERACVCVCGCVPKCMHAHAYACPSPMILSCDGAITVSRCDHSMLRTLAATWACHAPLSSVSEMRCQVACASSLLTPMRYMAQTLRLCEGDIVASSAQPPATRAIEVGSGSNGAGLHTGAFQQNHGMGERGGGRKIDQKAGDAGAEGGVPCQGGESKGMEI
jgi:hypothetical protein